MTHITASTTDKIGVVPELSPATLVMWAKSPNENGNHLPLWRHMADAAAITGSLWDVFLPACIRSSIAQATGSPELAGKLLVFLATAHDVGKATPVFASMPGVGLDAPIRAAGLQFGTFTPQERREFPHWVGSYRALSDWLQRRHGWTRLESTYLAAVPGGHHGRFPWFRDVKQSTDRRMGDANWRAVQDQLLEYATTLAGLTDDDFAALRATRLPQHAAIAYTALVIMGDWLASTESLFSYSDPRDARARAESALRQLKLPPSWHPRPPKTDDELFRTRHQLGAPRPVQSALAELARSLHEPEMIIVEAPTGEGKTKAALAAAEILCEKFGLGGMVFALPTRATSDGMFSEVRPWITRTLGGDDVTLALVHGTAEFNPEYEDVLHPTKVFDHDCGDHEGTGVANWWLSGRGKLATLSSVVVCTIDQILVAALAAKHVVLRHLGLAGKVVILDEVHAADSYMAEYLKRALTWLGTYGVPVIALSATLPPDRRAELLDAYNEGRGRRVKSAAKSTYPILTHTTPEGSESVALTASGRSAQVVVDELAGSPADIAEAALTEGAHGGHIAIVCNTVTRAQEVMRHLLLADTDADVRLLHSRFLGPDRRNREAHLRDALGPHPSEPRRASDTVIVVATQVIEQALDLDFDLMFSDIAPIDLLIQRAGRLHRHSRPPQERPESMSTPRLIITGFTRQPGGAPTLDKGCEAVYGASALLRSLAVLDRLRTTSEALRSPEDVASLVSAAYRIDLPAPIGWETRWAEADEAALTRQERQRSRAKDFTIDRPSKSSLLGWPTALAADPSTTKGLAQVRDSDDAIEVVVIERDPHGRLVTPRWDPELPEPLPVELGTVIEDDLARRLAQNTVRLPSHLGHGRGGDLLIDELERRGHIDTWQQSRWLRGALPLILGPDGRATIAGHEFRYDDDLGLIVDYRGEE